MDGDSSVVSLQQISSIVLSELYTFFAVPSEISMCYHPVDPGNCTEQNIAFFYDLEKRVCTSFVYTGCGGNENRFNSEEQCERQCGMFRGQGKEFFFPILYCIQFSF